MKFDNHCLLNGTVSAVCQAHDAMWCHSTTLHVLHRLHTTSNTQQRTHTRRHSHTYVSAHSQTHSGLLLSTALQLTASLGVVFLSSWLARIKQHAIFAQPPPYLPFAFPLRPRKSQRSADKAPRRRPWNVQPARSCLASPRSSTRGSPRGLGPTAGALWPACSPVEPDCLSGAPLSSFREPCNKKSRLWRHTMWKGGRFKKEKNASKNNKSQL